MPTSRPATARIAVMSALGLTLAALSAVFEAQSALPDVHIVTIQLAGIGFLITGAAAWLARPELRLGELMIWLAIALYSEDLQLADDNVVSSLGLFFTNASTPVLVHVLLAFPSGRVLGPIRRVLVGTAYVLSVGIPALKVPFTEPSVWYLEASRNVFQIHRNDAFVDHLAVVYTVGLEVMVVLIMAFLAVTYHRSPPLQRRVLLPAYTPFVLIAVTAMISYGVRALTHLHQYDTALDYAPQILYVLWPVGLLIGALSMRTSLSAVTGLASFNGPHEELEMSLRAALRDPELRLLPPGQATVSGRGRAWRLIIHHETVLGVLDHRAELLQEPALLEGAAGVIGVTLHNRQLKELAERQRDEVQASRLRIMEAGHEARRRLEQDLHDGSQQRLLAVIIRQRLLEADLRAAGVDTTALVVSIDETERALHELREVARGIHPALLAERGLNAALHDLVARIPVPITFQGGDLPPLEPTVARALYFGASECVTNAVRHAHADLIQVSTHALGGLVQVIVRDDGRGGAKPDSQGLRGVADRLAAIHGEVRLESIADVGTTVTMSVKVF